MKVIAYDPYIADARFKKYNVKKCETLDELLKESDVITIHTPKTEETMNMITYKDWQAEMQEGRSRGKLRPRRSV